MTLSSVLIVDDSPMMRKFIARVLAAAGFAEARHYFARDGNEAFEVLSGQAVDLVISDINMPNLDGEGLLRRLAEDDRLQEVPVLMVSSDSTIRARSVCWKWAPGAISPSRSIRRI